MGASVSLEELEVGELRVGRAPAPEICLFPSWRLLVVVVGTEIVGHPLRMILDVKYAFALCGNADRLSLEV